MDTVADVLAWIVLIIVPVAVIYLFWQLHILPEKIAEKRNHPQLDAIKTICLLSLAFGGMLWPIAWVWAYTKPVFHRMAYGKHAGDEPESQEPTVHDELERLRRRLASLEEAQNGRHEPKEPH